uniref:FAS1 domain-containing protein n=1 Tax=Candidozyma auris TaxID=498019 RepID=A0A0L0NTP6_CANAR
MLLPSRVGLIWLLFYLLLAFTLAKPSTSSLLAPEPSPSSIIDYLSSEVQYSYFLRHLQRSGLVPQINQLQNVTLFAPINLAFVDDEVLQNDTPENLWRYFANQRLRIGYLDTRNVVADSLYVIREAAYRNVTYPLKLSADTALRQYNVNGIAQVVEFDFYAKHQHSFVQAIDKLLPLQPSICDLLLDGSTDYINGHKMAFVKRLFQLMFDVKKAHGPRCSEFLGNTSTILLPLDSMIEQSLLKAEIDYFTTLYRVSKNVNLETSKDAIDELSADVRGMLSTLLLPELVDGVNGTDHPVDSEGRKKKKKKKKLKPKPYAPRYNITLDDETNQIIINGAIRSTNDSTGLTARDGIVHIFDAESNGPDTRFFSALNYTVPTLIPRKVLYSLHFSQFVEELRFRRLGKLINGKSINQTLILDLSDRDDFQDDESMTVASFSSKQNALYRFLEGQLDRLQVMDSVTHEQRLMTSKLCLNKRIGLCFKVKVTESHHNGDVVTTFNNDIAAKGKPVWAAGDTSIYIADKPLLPPLSLKHTFAELLTDGAVNGRLEHIEIDKEFCMWTLEHLKEHGLNLVKENNKGYTLFLPCGHTIWGPFSGKKGAEEVSLKNLGLTLRYLESHPKQMKDILKGLFIEDLIYSDFGLDDDIETTRIAKTLRGDMVNISESYRMGEFNHLIKLNETLLSVPLNSDVLFSQGVIHITSNFLLPQDFRLSMLDLLETTESSKNKFSFISFVRQFPVVSNALHLDKKGESQYSVLVPKPELLQSMNITKSFSKLHDFVQLHLMRNEDAATLKRCMSQTFDTNQTFVIHTNRSDGEFTCEKNFDNGKTYLKLQSQEPTSMLSVLGYNSDRKVKVVTYGCTSAKQNASCVFLLEKPFNLAWFSHDNNFLHIGWFSVALGVLFGILLFGTILTTIVLFLGNRPRKLSKPLNIPSSLPLPPGPTFMRVTSDEDMQGGVVDYGYESDDDLNRNESESLLLVSGLRKKGRRGYGSIREERMSLSPVRKPEDIPPSAPRQIKPSRLSLSRTRNLPG